MNIRYRNKYGNVKENYKGYLFASGKEKRRYQELVLLHAAGEIQNLQVHPPFTLQKSFRDRNGKMIQAITVKWDFYYMIGTQAIVEDAKSPATRKLDAYNIRRRLFIFKYPDIDFREV